MPNLKCGRSVHLLKLPLCAVMPRGGADFTDQFWPETNVFARLTANARLFAFAAATRTKAEGYGDGEEDP